MKPRADADAAAVPPAFLTPEQLGELYQVSGRTIRDWYHQGLIPAEVAVGRVFRFSAERVAEALRTGAARGQDFKTPRSVVAI